MDRNFFVSCGLMFSAAFLVPFEVQFLAAIFLAYWAGIWIARD